MIMSHNEERNRELDCMDRSHKVTPRTTARRHAALRNGCKIEPFANKVADGRAYWAGMEVLWCICCCMALAVLVEQPDTI